MKEAPSVAAMVANRDSSFSQWPTTFALNPVEEFRDEKGERKVKSNEMVEDVGQMLMNRRDYWIGENNTDGQSEPSEQIILYRDGLSEGQLQLCKDKELRKIRAALFQRYQTEPQKRPRLLVICTIKRHNTRFYGQNRNREVVDHRGNASSGAVIYDEVTQGMGQDFFLMSQSVIQGTGRPVHYAVLHNEIPDLKIQEIAQAVSDRRTS